MGTGGGEWCAAPPGQWMKPHSKFQEALVGRVASAIYAVCSQQVHRNFKV